MKSYPNNLLRQLFPGEQFDNLADDSGIALDYVISETMSEREALFAPNEVQGEYDLCRYCKSCRQFIVNSYSQHKESGKKTFTANKEKENSTGYAQSF